MPEIRVTMTAFKKALGEFVNRAAYGKEWIILVAHGHPKAAIVSMEDLKLLRQLQRGEQSIRRQTTLEELDDLRERIRRWREAHSIPSLDSADLIHEMREERTDALVNMR